MHPACEACRGACCETFTIPLPPYPPPDTIRWLGMRGDVTHGHLRLHVPCVNLTDAGTCGIYEQRPQPCRDYPVGSDLCRNAITARRSANAAEIEAKLDGWTPASESNSS